MNLDKSKWTKVKLGDVVIKKEENDRENAHKRFDRFLKVEHMDAESLHIKRWSSQKEGDQINPTFYKIFREGQILFPTRNPHLRRSALATFNGICGEKTLTLEPDDNKVLPNFIPFLFHSDAFYAHTTSSIIGSTNPHCRWRDVANFEFLLPSIDEQAELANLLWSSDILIESKIKIESSLLNLLRSIEASFFISNKNDEVKLGSLVQKLLSGGTPNTKNLDFYKNGNTPWITTKLLVSDYVSKGEKLITDEAIASSATKVLPKGNILAGTRVGVGKFSINEVDMAFSQDVTGLIIDKSKVDINFLLHQLNSFVIQHKITPFLQGTTIKGITKDNLLNLKVYLPNHEKQQNISKRISDIKEAISKLESQKKAAITLNKSLINQVF